MKAKYDPETDILYIRLNSLPVQESDEDKPGVILDYAIDGSLVGIEVLNASRQTDQPAVLEHEVAG
jgi:uncharacterized protein YuzE